MRFMPIYMYVVRMQEINKAPNELHMYSMPYNITSSYKLNHIKRA